MITSVIKTLSETPNSFFYKTTTHFGKRTTDNNKLKQNKPNLIQKRVYIVLIQKKRHTNMQIYKLKEK